MKDEIKHLFNDGDAQACTYTENPFTAKPDYLSTELVNKKNSLICNVIKVHRRGLKILHWPTSG